MGFVGLFMNIYASTNAYMHVIALMKKGCDFEGVSRRVFGVVGREEREWKHD